MRSEAPPSYEELRRDLPRTSPRAWWFGGLALASRAGAALSDGLRAGHAHGFDSGPFMDHVYRNVPSGRTPLGRRLDRQLLSRRTCVAFRDVRDHSRALVLAAIDAHPGGAPLVADLAAGPAPYLLEALAQRPRARALACDLSPAALATARAGAARLGVGERVELRRGDAFDRGFLGQLGSRPDIAVELGLYGIYHDDGLIERHLRDLAERVAPGQLVVNVQTQNPEIEHIARVWRDSRDERCIWRLRPLEQILGYARAAGYEPADVRSDRHGIYRVARLVRCEGSQGGGASLAREGAA